MTELDGWAPESGFLSAPRPASPARSRGVMRRAAPPTWRSSMISSSVAAAGRGVSPPVAVLPRPADLPEGLPREGVRVHLLVDANALSYGISGAPGERANDRTLACSLDLLERTAENLSRRAVVLKLYAASTTTAVHHLAVVLRSANNTFTWRRGLNGADQALVEFLSGVARTREQVARRGQRLSAEMVVLVGASRSYASEVRRLRLLGCPTWVIVPSGSYLSADLSRSAAAVTEFTGDLVA